MHNHLIIPNLKPFELDLLIKLAHSPNNSKNSKLTGPKFCEFFVKINRCREILFVYPCPNTFHVHLSVCSKLTHFCNACRTCQNESRLFYIKIRFSKKMLEMISKIHKIKIWQAKSMNHRICWICKNSNKKLNSCWSCYNRHFDEGDIGEGDKRSIIVKGAKVDH